MSEIEEGITKRGAPIPCIVCGAVLEAILPAQVEDGPLYNVPYGGTRFITYGHYGSTLFDPLNPGSPPYLQINLCDVCLRRAAEKKQVIFSRNRVQTTAISKFWDPEQDEG